MYRSRANTSQVQYVQNFLNGAWTQFQGWNANCFEIFNDELYFGGNNGVVTNAYQGPADLVSPIVADMQCAFNYFGAHWAYQADDDDSADVSNRWHDRSDDWC